MGSKTRKPDKIPKSGVVSRRNPVATNPLLGKGGQHKDVHARHKQQRAAARRKIKQMIKGRGEDSWHKGSSLITKQLELLCQLPFSKLSETRSAHWFC